MNDAAPRERMAGRVLALALLAPTVPMVLALLARHLPTWVPDLDLSLTELRVRDVGGPDTPLIGLPGRFGTFDRQGSHPGPLSFYLLAPTYRLLGSSSFALQSATVLFHLAGVWTAIVLVARRVGARWALVTAAAITTLLAALGPNLFTEPWNPHLPVLWFPAFLVAVWIAFAGDARVLPVVVVAGAICAQTHVSYLGPVSVLTVGAAVGAWGWPEAPGRRSWRGAVGAVALGVILWAPPTIDQVRHDPGNAEVVVDHLLHASDPPVGVRSATRLVLEHLDLWHLGRAVVADPGRLGDSYPDGAAAWRGALLLVGWGAVALTAGRRGSREHRALHALGGGGLLLGIVSVSRILGEPWGYLLLWLWPVALVLVLAIVASESHRASPKALRMASIVLVVMTVGLSARATLSAGRAEEAYPVLSRTVTAMVPTVVEDLEPGERYLVRWSDSLNLGGHGYGMFNELERQGVDVAIGPGLGTQFGDRRVAEPGTVDDQLVVATGDAIEQWARVPAARELIRVDVRTADERRQGAEARAELLSELRRLGLDDLVPVVDDNLYAVAFDPRLDRPTQRLVARLGALGAPGAVFVMPAGTERTP